MTIQLANHLQGDQTVPIPSPTEYLKTHIIAFLAGAATVVVAHWYAKFASRDDWGSF